MMRLAAPLAGLFLLIGCASDQSAAIPPDPNAPFPLANTQVIGQPQPGVLLIQQRSNIGGGGRMDRAARTWCGGPASVTRIRSGETGMGFGVTDAVWLVRCG